MNIEKPCQKARVQKLHDINKYDILKNIFRQTVPNKRQNLIGIEIFYTCFVGKYPIPDTRARLSSLSGLHSRLFSQQCAQTGHDVSTVFPLLSILKLHLNATNRSNTSITFVKRDCSTWLWKNLKIDNVIFRIQRH